MPQDTQETDWIEWQGGECPVDPDTPVEVRFRDYEIAGDEVSGLDASFWIGGSYDWWKHESPDRDNDIIAYRVVSL